MEGYKPYDLLAVINASIEGCDKNAIAANAQRELLLGLKKHIEDTGMIFMVKDEPKPEEKTEEPVE